MANAKGKEEGLSKNPSFEQAMVELEAIVGQMDDGSLTLEQSLAAYRRGADLVKVCHDALALVRQQVQVLDGELVRRRPNWMVLAMRDDLAVSSLGPWMKSIQLQVEDALDAALPAETAQPHRLHAAMRYAVLGGGKRTRPLLVFAAGEACKASQMAMAKAAVAVELIHAYSLIHDDLPCMDDDVLRRGRPTTHIAFDEATALLAGDALQTLAFEVLATAEVEPALKVEMVGLLARASGSAGMAGGQAIDLASVGQALSVDALETMHRLKTGALLSASIGLGALCAGAVSATAAAALTAYGAAVGLAFQVIDDILDVETDTATLGKTAGKDAQNNKPTYVSLLGLVRAKSLAEELRMQAHAALVPLGPNAQRLAELADFVVLRKH